MPCNSDYMAPSWSEKEASRLILLTEEAATGKHIDVQSREWKGYHPDAYGHTISDERRDAMVAGLCAYCSSHDLSNHSLELQMWWRDHQRADQERLETERAEAWRRQDEEDRILREAEAIRTRRSALS